MRCAEWGLPEDQGYVPCRTMAEFGIQSQQHRERNVFTKITLGPRRALLAFRELALRLAFPMQARRCVHVVGRVLRGGG